MSKEKKTERESANACDKDRHKENENDVKVLIQDACCQAQKKSVCLMHRRDGSMGRQAVMTDLLTNVLNRIRFYAM